MSKRTSEGSSTRLKGELSKDFFGLEKAAATATGFGIGGPSVDLLGSVLISFYWVPPERLEQRHVLFRVILGPDQARALAEGILKRMAKQRDASSAKPKE